MPRSVRRAVEVLDLFSVERPYWGPSEVAVQLGIAKSSAHALLSELARAGLTERLPCGRHRLGWRLGGDRTVRAEQALRIAARRLRAGARRDEQARVPRRSALANAAGRASRGAPR